MNISMKTKEISAQEYNSLPREQKRKLKRSLEKQGLEMPEIIERVKLITTVDKQIYLKALKILERNNIEVDKFLDLAFQNLILTENEHIR